MHQKLNQALDSFFTNKEQDIFVDDEDKNLQIQEYSENETSNEKGERFSEDEVLDKLIKLQEEE